MHQNQLKSAQLTPIGAGGIDHKLQCWLCNENSAVYSGYPEWCFLPCWSCQKKYKGVWTKKTFWQKFVELLTNK